MYCEVLLIKERRRSDENEEKMNEAIRTGMEEGKQRTGKLWNVNSRDQEYIISELGRGKRIEEARGSW